MTYNIDKTKIKPGMVIHCDTEEKTNTLEKKLNSMGCTWTKKDGNAAYGGSNLTPFDDLLVKRSKLAEFLGVDDGQEFYLYQNRSRVMCGELEYWSRASNSWMLHKMDVNGLARALDDIGIKPCYSLQTIAQAKMFLEAGYESVVPDPESEKGLMYVEGFMGGTARHTYVRNMFTDVTERTLLSEIAGCEQDKPIIFDGLPY